MNDIDVMIRNRIKNDYSELAIDRDSIDRVKQRVKKDTEINSEKNTSIRFTRYAAAVAAMFVVVLISFNIQSIKAFMFDIYEKYILDVHSEYENTMSGYKQDINLKYRTENGDIVVEQYIITDCGVDFIVSTDSQNLDLRGVEFQADEIVLVQDNVIKSEGKYIASSLLAKGKWSDKDKITGRIIVLYNDEQGNLVTIEQDATLKLSKIYKCLNVSADKYDLPQTDAYVIENISLCTWYMKVEYRVINQKEDVVLCLSQGKKELLMLGAVVDDNHVVAYFELPDDSEDGKSCLKKIVAGQQNLMDIDSNYETTIRWREFVKEVD